MGLFDMFKKKEINNDNMKKADVFVARENFYADKEGNVFGAFALTEDVLTALPLDPKNRFKYQEKTIDKWKLIFISATNKGPVGELDYYLALEKLKQFSVGEKDGYLIINPLTLEEQKRLISED